MVAFSLATGRKATGAFATRLQHERHAQHPPTSGHDSPGAQGCDASAPVSSPQHPESAHTTDSAWTVGGTSTRLSAGAASTERTRTTSASMDRKIAVPHSPDG